MAIVDRTLLNIVQAVSRRVGNFKAQVETLTNPDASAKNMIECVNDVIRKMCRVKPSPMLHATYSYKLFGDVVGTGANHITGITDAGVVTGSGTTFTDTGTYATTDDSNAVLVITESSIYQYAHLRIDTITDATNMAVKQFPWATFSAAAYDYIIYRDRVTMPDDFAKFMGATVNAFENNTALEPKRLSEIEYIRNTVASDGASSGTVDVGTPQYVAVTELDGLFRLQVYPPPGSVFGIHVDYIRTHKYISADGDYVMIPDADMDVLVSGVEALWNSFTKEGYDKAYELWIKGTLYPWAGLKARRTDFERPRIAEQANTDPFANLRL